MLLFKLNKLSEGDKMATIQEKIAGLYVAFFDRAPDAGGLDYWYNVYLNDGDNVIFQIAEGFAAHPYFEEKYGNMSDEDFVRAVYTNVLNQVDENGIPYWLNYIGEHGRAAMVAQFVNDALDYTGNDPDALQRQAFLANKVEVGLTFAGTLGPDSNPKNLSNLDYDPAFIASKEIIANVTDDPATKEAAIEFIHNHPTLEDWLHNHAPVAQDSAVVIDEDTAASGNVIASDVDNDTLVYSLAQPAAHGAVDVDSATGHFTYTPNPDFNGTDSFVILASDGKASDGATINVTVNPVNDAPVAKPGSATTSEDTSVDGRVIATDVDGDVLTYSLYANPSHGSVTMNPDGTFTYTPDADFNGTDSFMYQVDDGHGGGATAIVSITVDPVNDAPVASDVAVTTDEDTPANGTILASDVDGDTLSYIVTDNPLHGAVAIDADGNFTYVPDADYNGADSFVVTVSDGNGGTDTATVNITIDPVNDAPVADPLNVGTLEDTSVEGRVTATDVDGDALVYSLSVDASHGAVAMNADGSFTYTPNPNYFGTDSFVYQVDDGHGGTDTATVNITIEDVLDTLTPEADIFVGSDNDDILRGTNTDLNAGDDLDGKGGDDKLYLSIDAGLDYGRRDFAGFSIHNFEEFNVTNDAGFTRPVSFDLSSSGFIERLVSENSTRDVYFNYASMDSDHQANLYVINQTQPTEVLLDILNDQVSGGNDTVNLYVTDSQDNLSDVEGVMIDEGVENLNFFTKDQNGTDSAQSVEMDYISATGVTAFTMTSNVDVSIEDTLYLANHATIDVSNVNGTVTIDSVDKSAHYIGTEGIDKVDFDGSSIKYWNDTVGSAANWVEGKGGNDIFDGSSARDYFDLGAGDDMVDAQGGGDTILGGAGNDTLIVDDDDEANWDIFIGGADSDTLQVSADFEDMDDDTLQEVENVDILTGSQDVSLDDQTEGMTINIKGDYSGELETTQGEDTINIMPFVTMSGAIIDSTSPDNSDNDIINVGEWAELRPDMDDDLEGFYTININGGLVDLQGSDSQTESFTINGSEFEDTLYSGKGVDTIDMGAGDDKVYAEAEEDDFGAPLGEHVKMGDGDDTYYIDDDDEGDLDTVDFGAGDDTLDFDANYSDDTHGDDSIVDSDNTFLVHTSNDANSINVDLDAQSENIVANLGSGNGQVAIATGSGNDTIYAGRSFTSNDRITTNSGDDRVIVSIDHMVDDDFITFGAGNDTLELRADYNDSTNGDNSIQDVDGTFNVVMNDISWGVDASFKNQTEDLHITGSSFADELTSGEGDDIIDMGAGDDIVHATHVLPTEDSDRVNLGDGDDRYIVHNDDDADNDLVDGGNGDDILELHGDYDDISDASLSNIQTITTYTGAVNIDLSSQTEGFNLYLANIDQDIVMGSGDDTIWADNGDLDGAAAETIDGNGGNDTIKMSNFSNFNAIIDLTNITEIENYVFTNSGVENPGAPETYNLTFRNGNAASQTDMTIDASVISDENDEVNITIENTVITNYGFNVIGSATTDILSKQNAGNNNNITFNAGAGDDIFEIAGGDLGGSVSYDGGAGTADEIRQLDGTFIDDDFVNVSNVEILSTVQTDALNATLGIRASNAGIVKIVTSGEEHSTGHDDSVTFDAAFGNDVTIDMTQGTHAVGDDDGYDTIDAQNLTKNLTIEINADGSIDSNDHVSGGSGINTVNVHANVGGATNTVDFSGFTDIDVINIDGDDSANVTLGADTVARSSGLTIDASRMSDENPTDSDNGLQLDATAETDTSLHIIGSIYGDAIKGGDAGDRIESGGGDDDIKAGQGNDIIDTGAGDDDVTDAGAGDDHLTLGDGADHAYGNIGADVIDVSDTDDAVDIVEYKAIDESTSMSMDEILGFVSGEDKIKLSDLMAASDADGDGTANEGFIYVGEVADYSGVQNALDIGRSQNKDLVVVLDQADNKLYIDLDDDDAEDMVIKLTGVTDLADDGSDFITT